MLSRLVAINGGYLLGACNTAEKHYSVYFVRDGVDHLLINTREEIYDPDPRVEQQVIEAMWQITADFRLAYQS